MADAPDEYLDPITYTVMQDPVKLPSGTVMDRPNVMRMLLSDPRDPTTRSVPCSSWFWAAFLCYKQRKVMCLLHCGDSHSFKQLRSTSRFVLACLCGCSLCTLLCANSWCLAIPVYMVCAALTKLPKITSLCASNTHL